MMTKYTSLQKHALKLVNELKLDGILIIGHKRGECEFAAHSTSLGHFTMVLETLRFMLAEEKDFIDLLRKIPKAVKIIDKLYEIDSLIQEFNNSSKMEIFPSKTH
jgi:coenzyme F420-reducing hydrogenase delta subunit